MADDNTKVKENLSKGLDGFKKEENEQIQVKEFVKEVKEE